MKRGGQVFTVVVLAIVIGLPFVLRKSDLPTTMAENTVVIITPHTESIRQEFRRGFTEWYEQRTGRSVYVDYRVIGGTSEISKFLDSQYTNSFRNYWENELGREWSLEVQEAFNNPSVEAGQLPVEDSIEEAARRAYLTSNVGSGIDVFFGGGTYDFSSQAAKGALVDAGIQDLHPEWFVESAVAGELPVGIPKTMAGEQFNDEAGRWYGAVLSSYGIIYNRDSLAKLGIQSEPRQWADLADPRYFGQIAVCDPTKSGAMTQAFEMILQQQMQIRLKQLQSSPQSAHRDQEGLEDQAINEGWLAGMRLIQKIAANARYFTDTSQKPNIDVGMGDCAAGMSIDFYGRFQQENIRDRSGDTRFGFHTPIGGSTVSADPIGLLRGAENEAVARLFIEFVLSLDGQKLWNFEVGAPGGPEVFSLRRPPIRPELYTEQWNQFRSDKDFNPYVATANFTYHREWTGRLFSEIRTIIRICFIDVREELVDAWAAIIEARAEGRLSDAERAEALMQDLSRISYTEASTTIDAALKAPRIEEVRLARDLSNHFRNNYLEAERIARGD
jgi:ABC-type Fe3+ transport system substrate-binding protein